MFKLTVLTSILLILTGIIGYILGTPGASGSVSITAFIPGFLGIIMFPTAYLWKKDNLKPAQAVAIFLGIFGTVGAAFRLPVTYTKVTQGDSALAFTCQAIMAFICFLYLLKALRSTIFTKPLTDK